MGFRCRKSVQLVPGVRMTFSTAGVSYSAGGRGLRVTRTASGRLQRTISIPSTGISHVATIGGARPGRGPAPRPAVPPRPGWFAAAAERELHAALEAQDWARVEWVMEAHADYTALAATLLGCSPLDSARPRRELIDGCGARADPGEHPFARRYIELQLPWSWPGRDRDAAARRDLVGLALAEAHQELGDLAAATAVVEQVEPTTHAAVSLAELYGQAGRFGDVVDLTDGIANQDDATALLCVFRGAALREQGHHQAARDALKQALSSRRRAPVIRHQALLERARSYLAEGKFGNACRDLERIRAENAAHPGMAEALAAAGASPGP